LFFQSDKEFAGFIAKDKNIVSVQKNNVRRLNKKNLEVAEEGGEGVEVINTAAAPFYEKLKDVSRRSYCFHDPNQPVNSLFLSTHSNSASGRSKGQEARENVNTMAKIKRRRKRRRRRVTVAWRTLPVPPKCQPT